MTTEVLPTAPNREALRALYDEAVKEINVYRDNKLTTEFYAKTGDAVFEAGYLALCDHLSDTRRLHTVSAPVGGGKTSFSYAFIAAVTRYAEANPDAPHGCVFVVGQITKADEAYRELNALLPGKVAVWTTDHDVNCRKPTKIANPAAQFARAKLRHYPVIVVTHQSYLGNKGHNDRAVVRNGNFGQRVLTIVDERPQEVKTFDILLSEAQTAREALMETRPELKGRLDDLLRLIEAYSYEPSNRLFRPGIELDRKALSEKLSWFNTAEAERVVRASKIIGLDRLFGFAKQFAIGCGCIIKEGPLVRCLGYWSKLTVNLSAGTVLLDATADVDGVSLVVPWVVHTEVPKARYDNLEIIHVPQHTRMRLNRYLKTAANQRAYVSHMVKTIKEHMAPGELCLVVCKKALFDAERVPLWPEGDYRFKEPHRYTEEYGWDIEGRKLCATYWGPGVGSNVWRKANVVFLFDEFHIPRRTAAAITQGLRGQRADQGDLASMSTLNSKAKGIDAISDGHRISYTKQMALRGRGRSYDENGVCGKQRLVVSCELKGFTANAEMLFPGAKIRIVGDYAEGATLATKVIKLLSDPLLLPVLTTRQIAKLLGKPWRSVSTKVLTPDFERAARALGWRYVSVKGRGGSRFERTTPDQVQAA